MVDRPGPDALRGQRDIITPERLPSSFGDRAMAGALSNTGQAFFSFAARQFKELSRIVEEDQTKKGTVAGLTSTTKTPAGQLVPAMPERREGSSVADVAFNNAAEQAFKARMHTAIITGAEAARTEFPNNPQGLERAFTAFYSNLSGAVPEELRAEFDLTFTRNLIPAKRAALKNAREVAGQQMTASINADILTLEGEAREHARNLFSPDPDTSGLAAESLVQVSRQMGERYDAIGPDGLPLFSPETKKAAMEEFMSDTVLVAARAGLQAADSKVGYIQTLDQRIRATGIKLNESQFQAVEDQLLSDLNQITNLAESFESRERENFGRWQDTNFQQLAVSDPSREQVEDAFDLQAISLQQRNNLLALVENPATVTDEGAYAQLKMAAVENTQEFNRLWPELARSLTPSDRRNIVDTRLDFANGGFLSEQMVKNAKRELRSVFNVTGLFDNLTGQKGIEFAEWMRIFDDRVLQAETAADAMVLARQVVEEAMLFKQGQTVRVTGQEEPGAAIVTNPDGTGINTEASTNNLLEDLPGADTDLDELERQIEIMEQGQGTGQ